MHLSFYPTSMPPQAAERWGVMEGRPALLLRRLNYDQHGRILDYDIEYWRHDSLRIESIPTDFVGPVRWALC